MFGSYPPNGEPKANHIRYDHVGVHLLLSSPPTSTMLTSTRIKKVDLKGFCSPLWFSACVFPPPKIIFAAENFSFESPQSHAAPLQTETSPVFVQPKHLLLLWGGSARRLVGAILQQMCVRVAYLCQTHVSWSVCFFFFLLQVRRAFPRNPDLPKGVKDRVLGEPSRGERGTEIY